jgi:transcriptional regulator with XRE-family HTH domain
MDETTQKTVSAEMPACPDFGTQLRIAREARGLTLHAMAEQSRIRQTYLQAFENGDLEKLPPAPYAVGFLRQYAVLLQLDPAPLVAAYRQVRPASQADDGPSEPDALLADRRFRCRGTGRFWWYLAIGALLAVVIGLLVIGIAGKFAPKVEKSDGSESFIEETADEASGQTSTNVSVPAAPVVAGPVPAQPLISPSRAELALDSRMITFPLADGGSIFRLAAKGAGWLEIEADQRPLQSYDMQDGTLVEWTIRESAIIRLDIAGDMQAWVDGREVSLPGACTVVFARSSTTADASSPTAGSADVEGMSDAP